MNSQRQQKINLLSGDLDENDQPSTQNQTQINESKPEQQTNNDVKTIIDPIEQLVKNNNILPLLAVIDHIDINMKIQQKPLLCIMATKFVTMNQVLKNKKVEFSSDVDRRTPLHYAIEANDVKAAAWCIENGNPNQRDNFGNTPILDAIRQGRRRCFLLCLKHKFYDERAPVFAAMFNKHWQLKVLHGLKYDIENVRDQQNRTAFERALEYCSFDCAQFLLKINNNLDIDKYSNLTQSKGLIRKLKRIKKQQSPSTQTLSLFYPLFTLALIFLGVYGKEFGLINESFPYKFSSDLYLFLIIGIVSLYILMFVFDQFTNSSNIKYDKKNSLEMLLNEPLYSTIPEICPMCVHVTDFRYDHCFKCKCCVEKFHFHSFVCVNKSNEVFWIVSEFMWLYLISSLITEFHQFMMYSYVSLVKLSGFAPVKLIAQMKLLYQDEKYVSLIWLGLLIFLFLYQLLYCFSLFVMMCLRRKYQEMIHSQRYHHLYDVVKYGDSFISKDKRILQRGPVGAFVRCLRNICVYFFIDN